MTDLFHGVRVLPVIEIEDEANGLPLAEALASGGVTVFEFTLRTRAALTALTAVKKSLPELTVGMGTVLNRDDGFRSISAGADFLVTPGTSQGLLDLAESEHLPVLLGAANPSDVVNILDHGQTLMKFFPAEPAGGLAYLKALAGPFPQAQFCPTGGIAEDQVDQYRALANVPFVGGSWVAPKSVIAAKDWTTITQNARRASAQA